MGDVIRQMTVDDIHPQTNIEWLWTLDLVEPSWGIPRCRHLKKKILDAHRVSDRTASWDGGTAKLANAESSWDAQR